MKKIKQFFKTFFAFLICFVYIFLTPVNTTFAVSVTREEEDNSGEIKYYDPDDNCSKNGKWDGNSACGGDYFDIKDGEERFRKSIQEWGKVAVDLQIEYGVPWSLFFAQKWTETSMGTAPGAYAPAIEENYHGYNWGGLEIGNQTGSRREEYCKTAGYSAYGREEAYPMSNGKCAQIFDNVGDMIGGYMLTYLRNGNEGYKLIIDNASATNYHVEDVLCPFANMYVKGDESNSCDPGWYYVPTLKERLKKAEEIGAEYGIPSAKEVAVSNNLPAGGKHPVSEEGYNLHQLGYGTHELHIDCAQRSVTNDDSTSSADAGNGSVSPDGLESMIWEYLHQKGLSDIVTAGIMGNLQLESGFNPTATNSAGYYGLVQWGGGRRTNVESRMRAAGLGQYVGVANRPLDQISDTDLYSLVKVQLDFALDESKGADNRALSVMAGARDVNEAAEMFLVESERAVNGDSPIMYYSRKQGALYQATAKRRQYANEIAERHNGQTTTGAGAAEAGVPSDGSNVTMIGDSITVGAKSKILELLPKADIHAESGKNMFEDLSVGGEAGVNILNDLVTSNSVRDVLVIALGTNNIFTEDNKQQTIENIKTKIIDKVSGRVSKIIFVNNYNVNNPNRYNVHNDIFNEIASTNPNIIVADWEAKVKANPSLIQDPDLGVHPFNDAGNTAFAELVRDKVGALSGNNGANNVCTCSDKGTTSSSSAKGGMTKEQAEKFAENYNGTKYDGQWTPVSSQKKINCVSLTVFLMEIYTDYKPNGAWGNGDQVVPNMVKNGVPEIGELKPMTVLSTTHRGLIHTAVIVSVTDTEIITIEAAFGKYGARVFTFTPETFANYYGTLGTDLRIADVSDMIDYAKLSQDVGGALTTTTEAGKAVVDASWSAGWITGGIEGYAKEDPNSSNVKMGDNSHNGNFVTKMPKNDQTGPNKIILHSTEGVNERSGLGVYPQNNAFISHFTVDMKNKKTYQHFPITKPADGIVGHDNAGGVQIEIMGFSTPSSAGFRDEWYLQNGDAFGDAEWAYLAKLLTAISEETGIKLESSVDWENPSRMSSDEFINYNGVVGHMHAPKDSHTDPGNIWSKLSAQLGQVTTGSTTNDCGKSSSNVDGFIHYYQGDYPNVPFNGHSIASDGCGQATMAMIVTNLIGEEKDPPTILKEANCNTVQSRQCLITIAEHYGLEAKNVQGEISGAVNKASVMALMEKYMNEGWLIGGSGSHSGGIVNSGHPENPFSSGGHYVGWYGVNSDGRWWIADPASKNGNWNKEGTDRRFLIDPNTENFVEHGIIRDDGTGLNIAVFRK